MDTTNRGFTYQPSLYLYMLAAGISLVAAFFPGLNLNHDVQAAIITIATAILTVITAFVTRSETGGSISVGVLVAAATTALNAAVAFGWQGLSDNRMATLTAALTIVLSLFLHQKVIPTTFRGVPRA